MAKYFDRERRQDSGVRIISLPIYQALSNNMKKISKREFFKIGSTIGVGASLPAASSGNEKIAEEVSFSNDLLDENFHSPSGRHFGTQVIHHGEEPGYQVTPISQDKASPQYQRPGNMANPTVAAILRKVIEAEGAEDAVGGSCGMGIISQTYMSLLKPGDRIVTHRCNYDWVMTFFRSFMPEWGVEVEFIDFNEPSNLEKSLKKKPATFVHFEPYVNPTMEVLDSETLIQISRAAGSKVILDNTWLTPYLLQPCRVGADLVIHSVTKYIGGHGNALGGVVAGKKKLISKISQSQNWLGGLLRPMDAFLITQGIKTLPLRMQQHCQSAQVVAEFLQEHPAVHQLRYGGLPEWNPYAGKNSLKGYGGMLGIEWNSDVIHRKFGSHLKLIISQTSLGDPVSRVMNRKEDKSKGIPKRYTRVSIGLEEPGDLITDFREAIAKCA